MRKLTEQEIFWTGEFGTQYLLRNTLPQLVEKAQRLWDRVLSKMPAPSHRVLEFGCNIGINLVALSQLLPDAILRGVEINKKAAEEARYNLAATGRASVITHSLFDATESGHDFVFTCGVLIHLNPDLLPHAYEKIYTASSRYICLCEYYNPTPLSVLYRGHKKQLFKRDFAGEFMDTYPEIRLVDYGFIYHRDALFPADDLTWFLMEKKI